MPIKSGGSKNERYSLDGTRFEERDCPYSYSGLKYTASNGLGPTVLNDVRTALQGLMSPNARVLKLIHDLALRQELASDGAGSDVG